MNCDVVCGSRPLAMSHGNLLRIVGGSSVLPGTWPWVVSFQFPTREGYKHFCAGSLINSRWVITTAHFDYLRVQIGTTQRSKPGHDSQTRAIKRLVDHEHFKHEEYHNDISLIELDRPVECNDYIQPACLPEEDLEVETLNHCYACGWGITEMKWRAEYADILQEAKVNLISNKICNRSDWYFMKVREENICAVSEEARIDRCKGDGGSPLMCRLPKSERFWVVGLNSWGIGCRAGKVPGVFTATQPFLKWIQGILKDPPDQAQVRALYSTHPAKRNNFSAATASSSHHPAGLFWAANGLANLGWVRDELK
uniref:Peptidase S1 domain-containing protein n=1 Tax=Salvator merianae TaxID=96440 RepID=A0A8D0E5X1_SALMN